MHTQLTEYTKMSCWLQGTKGRGSLDFIISYRIIAFVNESKKPKFGEMTVSNSHTKSLKTPAILMRTYPRESAVHQRGDYSI